MDAEELTHLSSNRADTHHFRGNSDARHNLPNYIAATGSSATQHPDWQRFDLTSETTGVDGYIPTSELATLVDHFHLIPDPEGEIVLRTTAFEDAFNADGTPWAAIAIDLAESLDTRESRAGHNELAELLTKMRHHER
ncbi:hypothetical protein ACFVMC_28340 [Nocardia sp. NPDC127579]|uniref:hypothetical protein n=1 Tax=Nocardia sp. NPDC127579 TaxID=3345402 RepID=UPI003642F17F